MHKKFFLFVVFFIILAGFCFSDEDNTFVRHTITVNLSQFSAGIQYEYNIFNFFSIGSKMEYKSLGLFTFSINSVSSTVCFGFGRFYPFEVFSSGFFIDGMLGYANLSKNDQLTNHLYYGARIGERFTFGKSKGFTIELALGFFNLLGDNNFGNYKELEWNIFLLADMLSNAGASLERLILINGPFLGISIGYRF